MLGVIRLNVSVAKKKKMADVAKAGSGVLLTKKRKIKTLQFRNNLRKYQGGKNKTQTIR